MTADEERAAICAWLRADADQTEIEAAAINKHTAGSMIERHKMAGEWATMISMKRGIALAIERLAHHEKNDHEGE